MDNNIERRTSDRRKEAKRIARSGVFINITLLIVGVAIGYYLAMCEVSELFLQVLK